MHGRNHLHQAASEYLRSAALQEVWWHEWGPEAFALARTLGRPILLNIGASWCRACRTMDREVYARSDIAATINERFVAIRVDRDERPDIDARYQTAVQAIAEHGGLPLTVFCTSEGDVYHGATIIGGDPEGAEKDIRELLAELADVYARDRESIHGAAQFLREQLRKYFALDIPGGRLADAVPALVARAATASYDPQFGGLQSGAERFAEAGFWR
ncbi:MAG: DUF255 domain-containing protein, partial [Deltaproteobacteria bacterium]|nr:DUF255 domain-containing protein [Deltaproteobacteria bacterium]